MHVPPNAVCLDCECDLTKENATEHIIEVEQPWDDDDEEPCDFDAFVCTADVVEPVCRDCLIKRFTGEAQ